MSKLPVAAFFMALCSLVLSAEDGKISCQEQLVDLGFLLDGSGSVRRYFWKEKNFIQKIASAFKITENGTHAGVITFSYFVDVSIKFTDYLSTSSFNKAVANIKHMNSTTRIDQALEKSHKILFTEKGKARPNSKKLLFLITDGRQNPVSKNGVRLDPVKKAEKLHAENVQIYAVGIGSKINRTQLQEITKDPKRVFSVRNFDELIADAFVTNVTKKLCQGLKGESKIEKPKVNCSKGPSKCGEGSCKCGDCGCGGCGEKPVYINIFQRSNNYVNQGQKVTQTGIGSSAGVYDPSKNLPSISATKRLSNEQIATYIKSLIPYYESMNKSLKELLARSLKNKINGNASSKK